MSTLDTRGKVEIYGVICNSDPSELSEKILGLLENAGISSDINDAICKLIEEGELKSSGSRYQPKGKLVGRECPNCTCQLSFVTGDKLTRNHPDNQDIVYCEHCDHQEVPIESDCA